MKQSLKTLAIVGGGAAGLAAAIAAGQQARAADASLTIALYERDDRMGRTILATGNGRCNFSNASIDAALYHNGAFAARAFAALEGLGDCIGLEAPDDAAFCEGSMGAESDAGNEDLCAAGAAVPANFSPLDAPHRFFRNLGLVWREEADGRQFPLANKASVVLDVLRAAADAVGVKECCDSDVAAIDPPRGPDKPFTLRMVNGVLKRADAVIVASGGRTVSVLDIDGLSRIAPKPVLGPLAVVKRDRLVTRELDNIRVRVAVGLHRAGSDNPVATENGELMFRKYGVSGICVFNLSRLAQPGDQLCINFLEGLDCACARALLEQRRTILTRQFGQELTLLEVLRGLLLPRVAEAVIKSRFMNPLNRVQNRDLDVLADLLTAFPLEIEGIADASLCQVRRGGFAVDSCDPRTMEARVARGLYLCGEALDVDGPCGGYNLHWAWSSGILAGKAAASRLLH